MGSLYLPNIQLGISHECSGSNEKVYYPNSVLASKPISNFYRSPDQWDAIDFQIHASTPVEKIGILKEKMTKYIESLPQFWYPTFRVLCKDIEDSNRMKMSIWMQHHLNFQVNIHHLFNWKFFDSTKGITYGVES
jgi:small-conductance mechanosensitive channel